MEPYILPLILLALCTTAGYFWGRKKNRWIGAWIARETEAALQPRETTYVNIGGCIGYHFTYALAAPFREAKGTFALLPRHSLLYLPISFLIRRHDRLYLQLFTDERLPGEAHILREDYYQKEKDRIAGAEAMRRDRVVMGERRTCCSGSIRASTGDSGGCSSVWRAAATRSCISAATRGIATSSCTLRRSMDGWSRSCGRRWRS